VAQKDFRGQKQHAVDVLLEGILVHPGLERLAKIEQHRLAVLIDDDIGGIDVGVDNSLAVRVIQRVQEALQPVFHQFAGQADPHPAKDSAESFAINVIRYHIDPSVLLKNTPGTTDMAVVEPQAQFRFIAKLTRQHGIALPMSIDGFDHHMFLADIVFGMIDGVQSGTVQGFENGVGVVLTGLVHVRYPLVDSVHVGSASDATGEWISWPLAKTWLI